MWQKSVRCDEDLHSCQVIEAEEGTNGEKFRIKKWLEVRSHQRATNSCGNSLTSDQHFLKHRNDWMGSSDEWGGHFLWTLDILIFSEYQKNVCFKSGGEKIRCERTIQNSQLYEETERATYIRMNMTIAAPPARLVLCCTIPWAV